MAAEIRQARPDATVEATGESDQLGMFKVEANGEVLWDKYETGTFPEAAAIIGKLPEAPRT